MYGISQDSAFKKSDFQYSDIPRRVRKKISLGSIVQKLQNALVFAFFFASCYFFGGFSLLGIDHQKETLDKHNPPYKTQIGRKLNKCQADVTLAKMGVPRQSLGIIRPKTMVFGFLCEKLLI